MVAVGSPARPRTGPDPRAADRAEVWARDRQLAAARRAWMHDPATTSPPGLPIWDEAHPHMAYHRALAAYEGAVRRFVARWGCDPGTEG